MIQYLGPRRIIEVSSGHSTRIMRQAIEYGRLSVNRVAIAPDPRANISGLDVRALQQRFEEPDVADELRKLKAADIIFIDSSYKVNVMNDVTRLLCNAIPSLNSGVAEHSHDVSLPFDYPEPFCTAYSYWGQQYLLQVMLAARPHELLWPGYYIQRLRLDLLDPLPFLLHGRAQSDWFRTHWTV